MHEIAKYSRSKNNYFYFPDICVYRSMHLCGQVTRGSFKHQFTGSYIAPEPQEVDLTFLLPVLGIWEDQYVLVPWSEPKQWSLSSLLGLTSDLLMI